MSEHDQLIQLLGKEDKRLLQQERAVLRAIRAAYEAARRDLVAQVAGRYERLQVNPTPAQIRTLANDVALIRAIEQRLAQLERELGETVGEALNNVADSALAHAVNELDILGITAFNFAIDPILMLAVQPAIDQIPGLIATQRATLLASMREQLAAGERFSTMSRAVFAKQESIFSNGVTSAQLMVRRAVIQANNNAKMLFYEESGIRQKQVVANVSSTTTTTCLKAHGQIQPIDKPFDIKGRPSFGRKQMQPPFHWNCRTGIVPYLPRFETDSELTTDRLQAAAKKELDTRK